MIPKKRVKVAICIPNEGHTLPEAYGNRLLMCFHLGMLQLASEQGIKEYQGCKFNYPDDVIFEFAWMSVGRVLTPLARERLTEWAVDQQADYMLMVDDDMMCPTDLFERLYNHQKDIVGALAFMRLAPHKPVIFLAEEGYDPLKHLEYYIMRNVTDYPKDTLVECDAVGFGAVLINMRIVQKMKKPWFMSTTSSGEDLWFCRKAKKEADAHVFMDTSLKIGHLGIPPIIEEKDFEREFKGEKNEDN